MPLPSEETTPPVTKMKRVAGRCVAVRHAVMRACRASLVAAAPESVRSSAEIERNSP